MHDHLDALEAQLASHDGAYLVGSTFTLADVGMLVILARLDEVRALGYPERFIRMWEFYLCYCEGAFLERAISDVHMVFTKPGSRLRRI